MQLYQTKNDLDYKEFKLCKDNGDIIVSFDVEISNGTALISYATRQQFRNQGFASLGLNMLKNVLFSDTGILFLQLINLSGDYSRKVAENAGFFSPSHSIDDYILLNPDAEIIIEEQIHQLNPSSADYIKKKNVQKKIKRLRVRENYSKKELRNKLEQLLQQVEVVESGDYKEYIETEIHHLQNILGESQNNINKKRL